MTPIILHIEYLLQYHECVILPGIGAFVTEYIPSRLDPETGIITPPSKIISLNQAIKHDDGMLATSIARKEQIKFEEARSILYREVNSISSSLEKNKEYSFGKIGYIKSDDNNKIEFFPKLSGFTRSNASGCPVANMHPINSKEEASEAGESLSKPAPANEDLNSAFQNLPPHCYVSVLSKKNYYLPINKIFARSVACLIILAVFALPFLRPQQNLNREEVKASLNPIESLSSPHSSPILVKDSNDITKSKDSYNSVAVELSLNDSGQAVISQLESDQITGSYLIVGTFKNQKEAENFVISKNTEIIPLQIIHNNHTWRVSAAHGDVATLRLILNSDAFKTSFSEAWIWNSQQAKTQK